MLGGSGPVTRLPVPMGVICGNALMSQSKKVLELVAVLFKDKRQSTDFDFSLFQGFTLRYSSQ